MSVSPRLVLLSALFLGSAPTLAQTPDSVLQAMQFVESHKVSTKVSCSIPVPALWDAPPWEQQAAFRSAKPLTTAWGV